MQPEFVRLMSGSLDSKVVVSHPTVVYSNVVYSKKWFIPKWLTTSPEAAFRTVSQKMAHGVDPGFKTWRIDRRNSPKK